MINLETITDDEMKTITIKLSTEEVIEMLGGIEKVKKIFKDIEEETHD